MSRTTQKIRKEPVLTGLRGLTPDDVPGLIQLLETCREADKIESIPTSEQLRFQFSTPGIEITENAFILPEPSGALIASISAVPLPGAKEHYIQIQGVVRPDYRDDICRLEDLLLEFGVANATEWIARTANRASIQAGCRSDQQRYIDLFTRHGFSPVRYFHTLERDLHQPIEDAPMPEGVVARAVDFDRDAEALHLALHEPFQDHFNPMNFTLEQTKHWASSPEFKAGLIMLAFGYEDGMETEPAAICMNHIRTNYNLQQNKLEGEVGALGVRRPFRRRGLARAMLTQSLRLLKQEGMNTAVLSVDSENPLGATQLYASVGFTERKTHIIFEHARILTTPAEGNSQPCAESAD